jgi:hypothetical protein
MVEKLV